MTAAQVAHVENEIEVRAANIVRLAPVVIYSVIVAIR